MPVRGDESASEVVGGSELARVGVLWSLFLGIWILSAHELPKMDHAQTASVPILGLIFLFGPCLKSQKYHQRQLVDASDPTYTRLRPIDCAREARRRTLVFKSVEYSNALGESNRGPPARFARPSLRGLYVGWT